MRVILKVKCCFAFAAIAFACFAAPASASVVEYSSLTDFNAAVSGTSTYNFNGIANAGETAFYINPTIGGVTFTDNSPNNLWAVVDFGNYNGNGYGTSFFTGQSTTALLQNGLTLTLIHPALPQRWQAHTRLVLPMDPTLTPWCH